MTEAMRTAAERVNAGEVPIFGGRISWRAPMFEHSQCWQALVRGYGNLQDNSRGGDALVERSRSVIASNFLASDCEVLLTVDDDIIFSPTDALTMCAAAIDRQAIVCGVYVTRSSQMCRPAVMFQRDRPVEFVAGEHHLAEILYGASGFMAIPRVVFEKLAETMPLLHKSHPQGDKFYPFYHTEIEEGFDGSDEDIMLSEDYAFCKRAREAGFPIYADTGVRLGHIGSYVFTFGDVVGNKDYKGPIRFTQKEGHRINWEWEDPDEVRPNRAQGLVLPSGAMVHEKKPALALVR